MKRYGILSISLVLLGILLNACSSSGSSNQVNVSLSDFKIQSSQTTFTAGITYHFVVVNNGHTNHEFMIMPPMSGQMDMGKMDQMALYHIDESELPPGSSKSFEFTFPSSEVRKPLELSCHLPGHYEAGMHLEITLTS